MRLVDKIRLLAEYAPLLSIAQEIAASNDPYERAMLAVQALDFLADKTNTAMDDNLIEHAKAVLGTDEGRAAFEAAVAAVKRILSKGDAA